MMQKICESALSYPLWADKHNLSITYPLARFRFEFEITSPVRLPEYAGSTLRGAFGIALRQLACVTRAKSCEGCLLLHTCPFPSIFEPPKPHAVSLKDIVTVPVPYVIEPPNWGMRTYEPGEILSFGFILIGKAQQHLPLCILAWQRALARGVGPGSGTANLIRVNWIDAQDAATQIHRPGDMLASHPQHITLPAKPPPNSVILQFDTPVRLQNNGHALLPAKLSARPLLTALARRASLLAELNHIGALYSTTEFQAIADLASQIRSSHDLVWRDWTRRSSRQQRTMQLGGCIGSWELQGDLTPFWDLLRLGSWLHVGKEASFGLGKYRLVSTCRTYQ